MRGRADSLRPTHSLDEPLAKNSGKRLTWGGLATLCRTNNLCNGHFTLLPNNLCTRT